MLFNQLADQDRAVRARLHDLSDREALRINSRDNLLRTVYEAVEISEDTGVVFIVVV